MALNPLFKDVPWYYSNGVGDSGTADLRQYQRGAPISDSIWADSSPLITKNESFFRDRGYTGDLFQAQDRFNDRGSSPIASDALKEWAASNGIVIGRSEPSKWDGSNSAYAWSLFDQNSGKPVGASEMVSNDYLGDLAGVLGVLAAPVAGGLQAAGLSPTMAGATVGGVSGGLLGGGGDKLFDLGSAAKGAVLGGIGGSFGPGSGQVNVGESLGLSNPNAVKFANQAASTLGKSLVSGNDPTQSLLSSGLNAGLGALTSGTAALPSNQVSALADGGDMDFSALGGNNPFSNFNFEQLDQPSLFSNGVFDMQNPFSNFNFDALPPMDWGDSTQQWTNSLPDLNFQFDPSVYKPGGMFGNIPDSGATGGGSGLGSLASGAAGAIKNLLGGASSAVGGAGNLAALLGGALGAAGSGGSNTATRQSQIDPRMEQYLYGTGYGDPNSFLGAAQAQYKANPSGINPTMQQGLDMSKAALSDPAYSQSYQQMRTVGNGLLGGQVAGNPFTNSQGPSMQAGGPGGLLGDTSLQALMARGRGLLG